MEVVWRPQAGPQKALIDCPFTDTLFGGARGGGKTDGVLGKWAIKEKRYGAAFNGVFFRQEMPQQDDLINRAKEIYEPTGAQWFEQKKMFLMPRGGRIRFRPLESVSDAGKYQGQSLSDAAVEEAGNYPSPEPIDMLYGALRSVGGVPIQLILTANPGGVGHQWLKARYVDPAPLGMTPLSRKLGNGKLHRYIFIPSKLQQNRILLANDPGYEDRLYLTGSAELVRAWVDGDWNVVTGAFFTELSDKHIIQPLILPEHWLRFRGFDWGAAKPFSVGWYAVSDGTLDQFPRGALIKYREWYGASSPNVGLKMTVEEVADGIKKRETGDTISYGVADPAIFKEDGGPSMAERFKLRGVNFWPADNSRISGWTELRARLVGEEGRPMIYFFSTCKATIRTIPTLQHDEHKPEDIDSDGEDHAGDETRYAVMSRPWAKKKPEYPKKPKSMHELTAEDLIPVRSDAGRI